jgi:hypothetical protein
VPPGTPLPAEARIVVLPSSVPTPTERLGLIPLLAVGTPFTVPMNIILAGPTTPT